MPEEPNAEVAQGNACFAISMNGSSIERNTPRKKKSTASIRRSTAPIRPANCPSPLMFGFRTDGWLKYLGSFTWVNDLAEYADETSLRRQ